MPGVPDGDVVLGLRPEHLRPASDGQPGMEFLAEVVEPLGDGLIVHGTVSGQVAATPSGDEEVLPPLAGDRAEITTKFEPSLARRPGNGCASGSPRTSSTSSTDRRATRSSPPARDETG